MRFFRASFWAVIIMFASVFLLSGETSAVSVGRDYCMSSFMLGSTEYLSSICSPSGPVTAGSKQLLTANTSGFQDLSGFRVWPYNPSNITGYKSYSGVATFVFYTPSFNGVDLWYASSSSVSSSVHVTGSNGIQSASTGDGSVITKISSTGQRIFNVVIPFNIVSSTTFSGNFQVYFTVGNFLQIYPETMILRRSFPDELGNYDGIYLFDVDISKVILSSDPNTAYLNEINTQMSELNKTNQQISDAITNSNSSGAQDDAGSFFSGFQTNTHGLTGIITAPLNLIQSITNQSCSPLGIPLPFVNETLNLPCMSEIYQSNFGPFLTLYQTITTGFIGYWVIVRIFALVKDFKNPDHDEVEVLDL